jgi:hypothetical protein
MINFICFIQLTASASFGDTFVRHINIAHIVSMRRESGNTVLEQGIYFFVVKETPEEIMVKIKESCGKGK